MNQVELGFLRQFMELYLFHDLETRIIALLLSSHLSLSVKLSFGQG